MGLIVKFPVSGGCKQLYVYPVKHIMTHSFISSSEIISSASSMTCVLHIFHDECHTEVWEQDKTQRNEMAMCLRDQADPGGHCPALTPLIKRQCIRRYDLQCCLEHWLPQLVRGQPQTPGCRAASQPIPALAHQLSSGTCETWLRWPASVFPDDIHALRVVFACLCTSTAQP